MMLKMFSYCVVVTLHENHERNIGKANPKQNLFNITHIF